MKKFNTITAEEISIKDLGEIPFVVDKLMPIGLNLLAGSPKVGKSWLALWLSIQVSTGAKVWDFASAKGTVLYLALEDNEIRLQNRLLEITEIAPANVHFCLEIAKLGGDIETRIKNFIHQCQDTKLIIIDTLQIIRPAYTESNYANDYSDLLGLKNLAYEYQVSILLIHHFRKQKDSDAFNQITGSTGLQGVVDAMYTLVQNKRGEKIATLTCIGRDIEPREMEIERTEENDWLKISDSLAENSLTDLNFINAVKKFMEDKENYLGTATELSSLLAQYSDDNFSNKIITKNLKRLAKNFEKCSILVYSRRTGAMRIVELVKASDENDA